MMFNWAEDAFPYVVFLPVTEIKELLKTATFGVVDFHQVGLNQFEIDRPGDPYHALVRRDYAHISESLSTIRSIQKTPEQLTRRLRDQYDLALHLDLLQIPKAIKHDFVAQLRSLFEPTLQIGDDEIAEAGKLRSTFGRLMLDLIERTTLDITAVTIGMKLDRDTRHLRFEIVVDAVPKKPNRRSVK